MSRERELIGLLRDVMTRGTLTGWEPGLIEQIAAALSQQAEPVVLAVVEELLGVEAEPAPAQDEQAQRERIDPFSVAEAIRKALDRNSCPNVFLVIAYEAAIEALSQQAEPVEPAPAQDGRNPTPADYLTARSALESCDWSNVPIGTKAILGRAVDLLWLAAQARPTRSPSHE